MITSTRNGFVARAAQLKRRSVRERERRFLVEGPRPVLEAFSARASIEEVFVSGRAETADTVADAAARAGVVVHVVSEAVMRRLTGTVSPQGVVAVSSFVDADLDSIRSTSCVPVLFQVRDPGNAGTILRAADAAGAAGVVLTRESVDLYNDKAVRASAGSIFRLRVVREVELEEAVAALRRRGFAVLAAEAPGEVSIFRADLTRPSAVLFGNEARGLPERAAGLADLRVRIPIRGGAESLNLAAAVAVVLFESVRQREALLAAGTAE